jgi:hypothetical protein
MCVHCVDCDVRLCEKAAERGEVEETHFRNAILRALDRNNLKREEK